MSTQGIQGIMIETSSWKESKDFWTQLGFKLDFETDHGSGQFSHPDGGPYVFVAERAEGATLEVQPVLGVADSAGFFYPNYTSIHRIAAARSGERSILTINETAHLRGTGLPIGINHE